MIEVDIRFLTTDELLVEWQMIRTSTRPTYVAMTAEVRPYGTRQEKLLETEAKIHIHASVR